MTALDHADIRWRVSNTWDKGPTKMGMLVGYIDSRTAMEALDVLDPNWSTKMEPVSLAGENGIRCTLIVNGVAREDVGVASNTEPLKGAFSDALKRAAVHFGVGRELYELPKIAVECKVKPTGKVGDPLALPVFSKGRWSIDRQYGWVKYDREPEDQPEQRGAKASSPRAAPVPRTPEENAILAELVAVPGMSEAQASLLADAVGVVKGERATADQLRAMLNRAKQPLSGMPTAPADGGAVPEGAAPPTTPPSDADGSEAATTHPERPPSPDASATDSVPSGQAPGGSQAAPTFEDVLRVSGGVEVPPAPGTAAYRALPTGVERAAAKAYHEAHAEPETLAEQLGAPLA